MTSDEISPKLPANPEGDKDVVASVRVLVEDEKLIRRAAVELDVSRSEFMAQASVERARQVLKRQRIEDGRKSA